MNFKLTMPWVAGEHPIGDHDTCTVAEDELTISCDFDVMNANQGIPNSDRWALLLPEALGHDIEWSYSYSLYEFDGTVVFHEDNNDEDLMVLTEQVENATFADFSLNEAMLDSPDSIPHVVGYSVVEGVIGGGSETYF